MQHLHEEWHGNEVLCRANRCDQPVSTLVLDMLAKLCDCSCSASEQHTNSLLRTVHVEESTPPYVPLHKTTRGGTGSVVGWGGGGGGGGCGGLRKGQGKRAMWW